MAPAVLLLVVAAAAGLLLTDVRGQHAAAVVAEPEGKSSFSRQYTFLYLFILENIDFSINRLRTGCWFKNLNITTAPGTEQN